MNPFTTILFVLIAATFGWWLAKALKLPAWTRTGLADRFDFSLLTGLLAYFIAAAHL